MITYPIIVSKDSELMINDIYFAKEFACKCSNKECTVTKIDSILLWRLHKACEITNRKFFINSAFRCNAHNKEVGGEVASKHLIGMAIDIKKDWPTEEDSVIIELLTYLFDGIGIGNTFVHCDIMPQTKRSWVYGNTQSS